MICIGIDQSKKFSQYTIGDEKGNIIKRTRIVNEAEEIQTLMESLPEGPKIAALEASRTWGWLHDELEKHTERVLLGNPLEMKAIAHAKVKTDSIDSETIYHLLRSDLLPACYVPPKEIREVKDQLRFRGFLIMLRGMMKNQIHVLVDRNHALQPGQRETKDLFSQAGLKALKEVELPDRERKILDELLKLLEQLEAQIAIGNDWVEALYQASPEAQLIDTVPGFHHFLSVLVRYEIGDIHRFREAKKLCASAGLVPSVYASGEKVFYGKITKRGNTHLRWALVEAVNPAVISDRLLRNEYEGFRERKGTKVARVAMARKLLGWVYRVWKTGKSFQTLTSQAALSHS
jgi:transposase